MVRLWDVETEKVHDKWIGFTSVESVCWSADGEPVLSGFYGGTVRVWGVESCETPCQKLRGETNNVFGVVHLPDVRRIITCSHDDSLLLWDLESGERMGDAWQDDGDDGDDGLGVGRITLSPNGKTVASGSNNGTVRLWDVETKKVVARWTGDDGSDVISLCWSTDGEHVLTGYSEGMIRVWNIRSGNTILGPIKTGHKQLSVATYFDDKTNIATGGEAENAIKIWDS
ncbi:WD40 repeat-like protein, partial [Rhizopogon vinicolor AM-OR11-026]